MTTAIYALNRIAVPAALLATFVLVPDLPPGSGVLLTLIAILDQRLLILIERGESA